MRKFHSAFFYLPIIALCSLSCNDPEKQTVANYTEDKLIFSLLDSTETGISFINRLYDDDEFDVFRYRNYYNGGGVAIGDLDNDGWDDIYFVSNTEQNKLYRNLKGLRFEDITEVSGAGGSSAWSTGVAMADVNGDGWLDIYVCNSGNIHGDDRKNELFINQKDGTFEDLAQQYGLADEGFSTHVTFFDYDLDGDLDCYILNNSFRPIATLGYKNLRETRDRLGGDKLMRNDDGFFKDVSEQAGIYGSVIGFGLGVTASDINDDGWIDIYVANDFYERDYLYINNKDGSFTENLTEMLSKTSLASMGADVGDINNDGLLDIFTTDMLPNTDERLKRTTTFESFDLYNQKLANDLYHQNMRNMLQLNQGNGTFVDVGQLSGVDASDWSWGALMADFNNDSWKEIFVANGVYKDVTDQDFIDFIASSENLQAARSGKPTDFQEFISRIPSEKLFNHLYTRDSSLFYTNSAVSWGLNEKSFSNGAAYGDLDNDGDLELVVNNLNHPSFIYENTSNKYHSLSITYKGLKKNVHAIGCKTELYIDNEIITYEHIPVRGFQSSMSYKAVLGIGGAEVIDSVIVKWPGGRISKLYDLTPDTLLALDESNAKFSRLENKTEESVFLSNEIHSMTSHMENDFVDFDNYRLLYSALSREGPAIDIADLNGDGYDDVFIGSASGHVSKIYLSLSDSSFREYIPPVFIDDQQSEDVDAVFFDADGDQDFDLYVVSGGSEFSQNAPALEDRLYINTSSNNEEISFTKSIGRLPNSVRGVGSVVKPLDYDNDGDIDLFLGERMLANAYGLPASAYLLTNEKGKFIDETEEKAKPFQGMGMITDAICIDIDSDTDLDILVVGEWMAPRIFENIGNGFVERSYEGLNEYKGWYNTVELLESDNGSHSFLLGNLGLNSRFKGDQNNPIKLYVKDIDGNATLDHIFTYSVDGVERPMALKRNIDKQLPELKKKFFYFSDYAGKSIDEVFTLDELAGSTQLEASFFKSSLLRIKDGSYDISALPLEMQFSPINSFSAVDINLDGKKDVLAFGNSHMNQPEIGRYDGNQGQLFLQEASGKFVYVEPHKKGAIIKGVVRNSEVLSNRRIILVRNNMKPKILKY